jgi:hypothetical protein
MSRQLLINNATAVPAASGSVNDPSELAEGRIGVFNADDFSAGTLDLTSFADADRVLFAQGAKPGEEPLMSPVFSIEDIKASQVSSRAYVAPVAQVTTVTAATGTGTATLRVVKVSDGFKPHKRITVETDITGMSAAEIATDLAAKINKAKPNFVTATTSTANIVLTADTESSFETGTDDSASGWTIAATTTPNFGSGTAAHIAAIEEIAFGGNYINRIYLPTTPPSYALNTNYDLFTILIPTNTTPNISKSNKYHELRLAVQATATGIDLPVFFGHEEDED